MGVVKQSRNLGTAYPIYWMWGGGYPTNLYANGFQPTQETESYRTESSDSVADDESLLAFDKRGEHDNGNEFFTTKTSVRYSHPYKILYGGAWDGTSGSAQSTFRGPLIPFVRSDRISVDSAPRLTNSELVLYGTRAINATIPTQPKAGLAQFLGELREGLPRLVGSDLFRSRAKDARSLGSEYLNVQFGWLPLVSDVRKTAQAVLDHSNILKQLQRDSGKVVRRRFYFPDEVTSSFLEDVRNDGYGNLLGPDGSMGVGHYVPGMEYQPISQEITIVKKTWFSGAYQYYLPKDDTLMGKLELFEAKANHLLGTRLTPSVLWELAPWSWLADWVGTIGISLENAELLSSDNLVLRYGYLMRQTTFQKTLRIADPGHIDRSIRDVSVTLRRVTKERRRATPYGFGLDTSAFNARQWAILGALGMTKAPRTLR